MRNALCLVAAVVVALGAVPALAEDIPLASLGLGSMQVVSDAEGMQVRGKASSFGMVKGTSLVFGQLLTPDTTKLLTTGKVKAGPGTRYAYGFEDARDASGDGWVGHGGGAPGMNGDLKIYPKPGYVVTALANLDPPAAQRITDYLDPRLPTQP